MRDINQISLEEFLETMAGLDMFANECIEEFMPFLLSVCAECRLAGEMFCYLMKLKNNNLDSHFELAKELHLIIVTVWLLLNAPDKMDTIH